ncbi:MAG: type III-A CRISPR-associated RAMP protein Csm3 [Desulfatirhabdiaceae bacterium]
MKLEKIMEIRGRIILKSGLRIGGGDMEMHIGGIDNPIIKHPHTQEPYIPGSSLKGKIRSLLELRSGLMPDTGGEPLSVKHLKHISNDKKKLECRQILQLFGISGSDVDDNSNIGPSRASFSDCPLDPDWKKGALQANWPLTEVKSENRINRIKGVAEHPRFTERVPAGAIFQFFITVKQLGPDESVLLNLLMEGMKLLELDALGGSGSRGYGRIQFTFQDADMQTKFDATKPFSA